MNAANASANAGSSLMALPFLSTQAKLALLGYGLVALSVFIPVKSAEDDPNKPRPYALSDRILVLVLMLLPMALSVYTINCLTAGQCNAWSWINSALVFAWSAIMFLVALYYGITRQPVPAPEEPNA